jgi:hypothetical protein
MSSPKNNWGADSRCCFFFGRTLFFFFCQLWVDRKTSVTNEEVTAVKTYGRNKQATFVGETTKKLILSVDVYPAVGEWNNENTQFHQCRLFSYPRRILGRHSRKKWAL